MRMQLNYCTVLRSSPAQCSMLDAQLLAAPRALPFFA
jgi:hypothetical protein